MEMNIFPDVMPPIGKQVEIELQNGAILNHCEYDGEQWWADLPDNPEAAPIDNNHVVGWRLVK